MAKQNCWEFKNCGRHPDGPKAHELGVCSASVNTNANSVNEGINGGRVCWAIAGTLCGGQVQGTFAHKIGNCLKCEFYTKVKEEQGILKFKMSF